MADYIYLLENRLSAAQRAALRTVAELARSKGLTVFLVGGAVRDLTSGSPVRDLDVAVQGNALTIEAELIAAGATISGRHAAGQTLFTVLPGGVRVAVGSTLTVSYPKPGQPVFAPAMLLEDLRRRDFTANAMALSLNPGSYGLLMDPLNGVADIENRQLRLVSNYGFIEDPIRMVRAARLMARLGWTLDEKTESRYQTGRDEEYIAALSDFQRGYELEEIVHEEDPLRVLRRLEADGWMQHLAPYWTTAKANVGELDRLRALQTQFQMQGIHPDVAALNFPLLTAKLTAKELATLKSSFPRPGFVAEIDSLDQRAKDLAAQLTGKTVTAPSQTWKLLHAAPADVVLWTAFTSKSPALLARFKSFQQEWPQFRSKIPYALLQEMRIVPELPGYDALLETLFFELMDGRLTTPEEIKAFLEPHSPPAPPPPVNARKVRASKKEAKGARGRGRKLAKDDAEDLDEVGDVDDEIESDVEVEGLEDEDVPDLKEIAELGELEDLAAIDAEPDDAEESVEAAEDAADDSAADADEFSSDEEPEAEPEPEPEPAAARRRMAAAGKLAGPPASAKQRSSAGKAGAKEKAAPVPPKKVAKLPEPAAAPARPLPSRILPTQPAVKLPAPPSRAPAVKSLPVKAAMKPPARPIPPVAAKKVAAKVVPGKKTTHR
jgi:tRNA nucleotidyltransferase/poly(A) polymerase